MIVLGLRTNAARALIFTGLMLLGACAREHVKDGDGPGEPNAIQDGAEDDQSGGTGGSMSAAGQGASGHSASQDVTGGMSASSSVDAGSSVEDAGQSVSVPADAGTETDPVNTADAGEPHESFVGCRGPADPGCAECSLEDGYASASQGADWYNVWTAADENGCGPDCPACASCTYRNEAEAIELGHRQECEPCVDPGIDPCFYPTGCGCYCSLKSWLSVACPTLF